MTSEETLRIRGYLTAQGAKLSPDQIIGKVQEAMAQRVYSASGLTTLRVDPAGATIDARLATLGRLMELVKTL